MLKKRIMGVVTVKNGIAVQSLGFKKYLPIGKPEVVVEYLNTWGIDEISVVDIDATKNNRVNLDLIKKLSDFCQVPLTYGGGIKSSENMTAAVQAGADKVMINQTFLKNPQIITQGAEKLGNQCVVVSFDFMKANGQYRIFDYTQQKALDLDCEKTLKKAQDLGVGELFLNSVDRDGTKTGLDIELAERFSKTVNVPVTICGGIGHPQDFAAALKIENISAVAAGNYFNFTEHSATTTKQFLVQKGFDLRNDSYFSYSDASFCENGRVAKKEDKVLKEMLFEFHQAEVI